MGHFVFQRDRISRKLLEFFRPAFSAPATSVAAAANVDAVPECSYFHSSCSHLLRRAIGRLVKPRNYTNTAAHGSHAPCDSASGTRAGLPLLAYCINDKPPTIEVAPNGRAWMNDTHLGFANRCLPLRIANQAGWFILNDRKIEVMWNGGTRRGDVAIRVHKKDLAENILKEQLFVSSHFGHGIVTWQIPYLFRTPTGYNLWVRGPTNWCKDGACPLDAIVETDWSEATFTMNWKVTRPGMPIVFDEGEPICMIFPCTRGSVEEFRPEIRDFGDNETLKSGYELWNRSRTAFNKQLHSPGAKAAYQAHYYVGKTLSGKSFSQHQRKSTPRSFRDVRTSARIPSGVSRPSCTTGCESNEN
jgi:hypothetical protein